MSQLPHLFWWLSMDTHLRNLVLSHQLLEDSFCWEQHYQVNYLEAVCTTNFEFMAEAHCFIYRIVHSANNIRSSCQCFYIILHCFDVCRRYVRITLYLPNYVQPTYQSGCHICVNGGRFSGDSFSDRRNW